MSNERSPIDELNEAMGAMSMLPEGKSYTVTGPQGLSTTKDWFRAGHMVQNAPGTTARKIPEPQGPDVLDTPVRYLKRAPAYVVKVGRQHGVYTDWDLTKSMVTGVSGAVYKGYPSLQAATAAYEVARVEGSLKSTSASPKKTKYNYTTQRTPQPRSPAKTSNATQFDPFISTSAPAASSSSSITASSASTPTASSSSSIATNDGPPVPWYLVKIEAIRNRKKWIVVFKGSDIGIFPDWLQAADYVVGVEGAIWNGFRSQEQAEQALDDALVDGFVEVLAA